jgi:NAD(P)-dependent dehydrogenase (short-subunit alcohol dehydrogenase family)
MSAQALVQQVEEDWGSIDVLINHAAVEPHVLLLNMDEWDWHRTLDVNLTGAFLMLQSVGRVMRARHGGVIINLVTGSGSGVGSERGAYLASMGGLLWLTRQAAHELGPLGVRVHAVGTGLEAFQAAEENIPRQWMDAVMFLCTSELNGQIVNVEE